MEKRLPSSGKSPTNPHLKRLFFAIRHQVCVLTACKDDAKIIDNADNPNNPAKINC